MINKITKGQSIKCIEENISLELKGKQLWGDLEISFEEYELNDFMCEDCYQDVHTDKHGNFHDDEYFDF